MEIKKYPNPDPNGRPLVDCLGCGERKELHAKGYCNKCYKNKIWKPRIMICKNCGKERPHKAFGLCSGCHTKLHHYDKTKAFNYKKWHNISLELYRKITKECLICGFDKVVELHHLDEDHKNNSEENLIGLCPNHHKMLHDMKYSEEIKKEIGKKLNRIF